MDGAFPRGPPRKGFSHRIEEYVNCSKFHEGKEKSEMTG